MLSIIIVNYNVKYFLEDCLNSIRVATQGLRAEIIVIDNNSSDGSVEYLQLKFPEVRFIANSYNVGFAKANNQALAEARGEYILFLNPDTILSEKVLERCIHFFSNNEKAGAIGVKMVDGKGRFLSESKRSFPTMTASFFKLLGFEAIFPKSRTFAKYSLGHLDKDSIHAVEVLAGAFMMIRKNLLDKIGSFDERFFMYGEDIDLSYRICQAQFINYYLGDVSIVHFKGKSMKRNTIRYVRIFYQAMIIFVQKHYHGSSGKWITRSFLKTAIIIRASLTIVTLPFRNF